MSTLDKWEAEAGKHPSTDNYFELYERILALIDLVRKKDGLLEQIRNEAVDQDPTPRLIVEYVDEALTLTEELK